MAKTRTNGVATDPRNRISIEPESPKPESGIIIIPAPAFGKMRAKIVGITPYISNAFPEKVKKQIYEGKFTDQVAGGTPKKTREVRNREREFRDSLYPMSDGKNYGLPVIAFKRAMQDACRNVEGLTMEDCKRWVYTIGEDYSRGFEVTRIYGKPTMREDMVRLLGRDKPPDVRYRGEFTEWSCILTIEFNVNRLNPVGILNLLQWAGKTVGVGEMRPSAQKKPFNFGMFRPELPDGEGR